MKAIQKVQQQISSRLPGASLELTEPGDPALVAPGIFVENWLLSIEYRGRDVIVEWRPNQGFGLSLVNREPLLYSGPDESFDEMDGAFSRIIDLLGARDQVSAS